MFMTSLNVKAAWERNLTEAAMERHFDAEFRFARLQPADAVMATVASVPGVRRVEPWSVEPASLARADGLRVVRTQPDGGHGSLSLQAVPRDSAFLTPRVAAGRWLHAIDPEGAVLNEQAWSMFPGLGIGDRLPLVVCGVGADLRLTGIVREHLSQATVYTSSEQFERITREPGLTGGVRVALESRGAPASEKLVADITRALENSGVSSQSVSQAQLGRAYGGHLFVLIFVLVVMSMFMATVGVMGLGSAMTIGVLERTREFAVLRVIGASAGSVRRMIVGEAVLIGGSSTVLALGLSLPLTAVVDWIVGTASFGPALGTSSSGGALPLWLAIIVVGSVAASAYPAWRASHLTIREALVVE
jgi:putative ABC transport system permease protein